LTCLRRRATTLIWLFSLYLEHAASSGVDLHRLRGTTQNDLVKEFLSRGTYIYPPEASRRLTVDMVTYCAREVPNWNPMNVCSYHLQEAGATPVQEIAYALATAVGVLDAVNDSRQLTEDEFVSAVASISFFVNAGIRFVEETCKMRAFTEMWDHICADRYGISDPDARRFRYGVQVNSLGLTESQPENNVQRIVLEALGVTLSKRARARSLQLPAWNEALGLPQPWDQQWSLRIQQVLAHETDLLEYEDIFDGSHVIERRTSELVDAAQAELDEVLEMGGVFEAIPELKRRLVESQTERIRLIESGEMTVVGQNSFTETAESPFGGSDAVLRVDAGVHDGVVADLMSWRARRDNDAVVAAVDELRRVAFTDENVVPASLALARAGGTTGEWAEALRDVFGEYQAPTGVGAANGLVTAGLRAVADRCKRLADGPPRLLVAKPGLDGHSNGAEQIAIAARDAGMEVIYQGIRHTPEIIAKVASDEDPDVIGLSILSGSHLDLVPAVMRALEAAGVTAPVVVGGIIPEEDRAALAESGVAAIYTPSSFELAPMMGEIVDLVVSERASTVR
jgi:(2R)-ethylmalonyl-CoA mutase